ncbi:hypothetical protein NIES25_59800 (plasmid) [Nostoc linckia NIES-25]|nr:hypothetical protein NIES25_59800 [Nostoc linckia NIES-25]
MEYFIAKEASQDLDEILDYYISNRLLTLFSNIY